MSKPAPTLVIPAVMRPTHGGKTSSHLVYPASVEWVGANVITAAPGEVIQIRTRSGDLLWVDAGILRAVFRFKVAERAA